MGNPGGGTQKGGNWIQQTTFDARVSPGFGKDSSQWQQVDHWKANLELNLYSGTAGYGQSIGSAFPLSASDHPPGLWLTEASIERSAGGGSVDFKAGILALNPGFVEAPVLNSYVNSIFNNTLNLNITALPINPYGTPGVELSWRPGTQGKAPVTDFGPNGEWRYGGFWLNPQIGLASIFGVDPDQPQINGHLHVIQWSFDRLPGHRRYDQPIPLPPTAGAGSNSQLISRQLPKPLLQIGGGYNSDTTNHKVTSGVASSLTLAAPLPLGLDNRVWLGLSAASDNDANLTPLFLSGGWLSQGVIPGRPLDVLALGFGRSSFNKATNSNLQPESTLELNYTATINSSFAAQPFLQWILRPGIGNILALGLQLQLQF